MLLCLFLLARCWHLWAFAGDASGFDSGDLLWRVARAGEGNLNPGLRDGFWAYHPPLAFWLANAVRTATGLGDVVAVQSVALAASLTAFFALRATLARFGLLHTPAGIALLYASSSLPLAVHSSASLNIDVPVQAAAAVALLCSVVLWGGDGVEAASRHARVALGAALVLTLTAALFTKFSGLLVGAVPLLVAVTGARPRRPRRVAAAGALILAALLLATPYYHARYVRAAGTPFPNVNEWWYGDDLRAARSARDAAPAAFALRLFAPRPPGEGRAPDRVYLEDAWRDLWFKDPVLGPTTVGARRLGRAYAWAFGLGAAAGAGALLLLRRRRPVRGDGPWLRLGAVLLPFGLLQAAALVAFVYQQPLAEHQPGKCLYILPVTWALVYLPASLLPRDPDAELRPATAAALVVVGWFVLANHLAPVY